MKAIHNKLIIRIFGIILKKVQLTGIIVTQFTTIILGIMWKMVN